MNKFKLIMHDKGHYSAEGDLTFFTINKKISRSFDFLKSAPTLCIDLAKINNADSAALALLIEWKKHSKLQRTDLSLTNIPQQILALAKLSGIEI